MHKINRRHFMQNVSVGLVSAASAGSLCAVAPAQQEAGEDQRPPNVILIITDDQGYGDFSCYGNPVLKTPHLDRLHGESARFTQFYVSPVCSPTRACLMTGRYNYRTGVVDTYAGRSMMDPQETTLAEMFGKAGYRTGIFGKWHLGDAYPLRPQDRGFDEVLVHRGGGIAQPSDPEYFDRQDTYFDPVLQHNGVGKKYAGYCTDIFTDAAMAFMAEEKDRPFFTYVAYNAPHTPLQVSEEDARPYHDAGLSEKTAQIYGMIANMDRNIGRLLDFLDKAGLSENTILLFMTDNGAQNLGTDDRYNAGLRDWKGSVYDGGIRVPLFVRWPRKIAGSRNVEGLAAHIDLAPTLLALCGATPSQHVAFDGISLLPLLTEGVPSETWPDRTLFFQWHRGDAPEAFKNAAVRSQRWKLVNGEELYDMAEDPGEAHNVADEHPGQVETMRKAYEDWFADVGASRGYAPVRIHVGNDRENPVTLTRQDWRTAADWTSNKTMGDWEVFVEQPGPYEVRIDFEPAGQESRLHLKFGEAEVSQDVPAGAASVSVAGLLPGVGDCSIACRVENADGVRGARFVTVHRK